MKGMNKLERSLGKIAIPHLISYIIGAYAIGLVLFYVAPRMLFYLTLEPYYIFRGQVWRLVSWIFVPSDTSILSLIMMIFYYQIGGQLEQYWGTFRFNLYMWEGIVFTDIAAIVLYFIIGTKMPLSWFFSTQYINLSLFLAFAVCFPNLEILLWFIIPIKMKWMAVVYALITFYEILQSDWVVRTAIIASIMNFIIFYLSTRNYRQYAPQERHRKRKFQQRMQESEHRTKHKCTICGRTEKDGEDLQFRYCSRCDGNHEYCQDHLFTHQHIKLQ
ncbi:hypothetical protein SAMN02910358_00632 [Lachnospiraceae bacterium XBB1006]|nr:hypothetical protein SAMN02910358_00632 [Lachnospiraceae bacterium XBB1006]